MAARWAVVEPVRTAVYVGPEMKVQFVVVFFVEPHASAPTTTVATVFDPDADAELPLRWVITHLHANEVREGTRNPVSGLWCEMPEPFSDGRVLNSQHIPR